MPWAQRNFSEAESPNKLRPGRKIVQLDTDHSGVDAICLDVFLFGFPGECDGPLNVTHQEQARTHTRTQAAQWTIECVNKLCGKLKPNMKSNGHINKNKRQFAIGVCRIRARGRAHTFNLIF